MPAFGAPVQSACSRSLAAVLVSLRGRPGDPDWRMLTEDCLSHWLVSRSASDASTMRGEAAHVHSYLAPFLGQSLTHAVVDRARGDDVGRDRQALALPVSAAALGRVQATLRTALKAEARHRLISENPMSRAELPQAQRPPWVWTSPTTRKPSPRHGVASDVWLCALKPVPPVRHRGIEVVVVDDRDDRLPCSARPPASGAS